MIIIICFNFKQLILNAVRKFVRFHVGSSLNFAVGARFTVGILIFDGVYETSYGVCRNYKNNSRFSLASTSELGKVTLFKI